MANLLELNTVEVNSMLDPTVSQEIQDAANLRAKVRSAMLRKAGAILTTTLPTTDPERGEALEQLAWAQQVVTKTDSALHPIFRLTLALTPSGATVAQITGADDATIAANIDPVVSMLAKGMYPGRQ